MAKRKSTPTTIADALRCVRKVRQGKACTASEMKATIMLLDDARKTSQATGRMLKERVAFLTQFINRA